MKTYQISVIVPVFNAKDRLMPLFKNLFIQNGAEDVEFIFIDDQSTDESYQILGNAAKVFDNVRILQMEKNGGPASCRNFGLDNATGDYVCFVDDDDTLGEPFGFIKGRLSYMPELENKFFENMIPFLGKFDIILCGRVMIEPDNIYHCKSSNDSRKQEKFLFPYNRALYMHGMQYICGSLFRRKLLVKHNIRFITGMEPNEDISFGVMAGYYAKKIKTSHNAVYGYHKRPDSLTHQEGERVRIEKEFLYNNRQFPLLLSHIMLKERKHKELCNFVFDYRYVLMRLEYLLFFYGEDFKKYSFVGAFPKTCNKCTKVKEVCTGEAPCPNPAEFEQFLKDTAAQFMPKDFNFKSI